MTFRTRFIQFRKLGEGFKMMFAGLLHKKIRRKKERWAT